MDEEKEEKQDEGRRKRRPGMSADIPVPVLPVPEEVEGPRGGPGRKGVDAGPPCNGGRHESLLPPVSRPPCLIPLKLLL